jgi:diguanylate cyclase (GGDEF)-like protein/PAS domain S-box-containing protein
MVFTGDNVTRIVSRVALMVAIMVGMALPLGYGIVAYVDFSHELDFKAQVKGTAFSGLITSSPDVWMFAENRMQGLLMREPVPLGTESVIVYDDRGGLVTRAGREPVPPVLRRDHVLYDATRVAGRIEVVDSLRPVIVGTGVAAALGLLLGLLVYLALRTFPLRALRRATEALFEQKERAEVTLHSIGDAVVTTDARGIVEFFNPMAEELSGWSLERARGRPLTEILQMLDAATGEPVASTIAQALADNRIVSFGREIDLLRADGSRLGIDERAAPIHDAQGHVTGGVLIFRDVSTARNLARQRSWEAAHDSLTGLSNRRELERLVELAAGSVRNSGKQHVVCYLDLDQFKVVNDTCGHAAGDELLKRMAVLMKSRIRESDTLARLGGDEFGLLLEGCSLDRAELICADLLAAVRDFRFQWDGKAFTVGVSVGVAAVEANASAIENLGSADTACYWAKEQGRNRVCAFRRGDNELEARRRQVGWIARINAALAEDRFVLYQQQYLQLAPGGDGRMHLEVLLRMIDDDGKLVQPGVFIPAAERYNLMPALDRWVVRKVFSHYGELVAARGGAPLTCAINLSATTINSEGFLAFVSQLARESALPAGSICFEITESSAINNLRHAMDFMGQCKQQGFLFALDDFGTGMSSFGYLKDLPVDYLKIDGSFVKNLVHNDIDRAMTEAINRIGHIMGIKTIAEYVENEAIVGELRRMGVDYAQGYGVCKPAPLFEHGASGQSVGATQRSDGRSGVPLGARDAAPAAQPVDAAG